MKEESKQVTRERIGETSLPPGGALALFPAVHQIAEGWGRGLRGVFVVSANPVPLPHRAYKRTRCSSRNASKLQPRTNRSPSPTSVRKRAILTDHPAQRPQKKWRRGETLKHTRTGNKQRWRGGRGCRCRCRCAGAGAGLTRPIVPSCAKMRFRPFFRSLNIQTEPAGSFGDIAHSNPNPCVLVLPLCTLSLSLYPAPGCSNREVVV